MITLCKEAEGGPFLDILLYNYKSENSTNFALKKILSSVEDPWHFGADPDPRIRT